MPTASCPRCCSAWRPSAQTAAASDAPITPKMPHSSRNLSPLSSSKACVKFIDRRSKLDAALQGRFRDPCCQVHTQQKCAQPPLPSSRRSAKCLKGADRDDKGKGPNPGRGGVLQGHFFGRITAQMWNVSTSEIIGGAFISG